MISMKDYILDWFAHLQLNQFEGDTLEARPGPLCYWNLNDTPR
jgi:hypothetical protein